MMLRLVLLAVFLLVPGVARAEMTEAALWDALRQGGHVVMFRHALAPGGGDPDGFRVEDCATQRNLNDAGREQARRIGATFRDNGVRIERVLSSQWCRALDTARLAFAEPEPFPPLNSFFAGRGDRNRQTEETRAAIAGFTGPGTMMMTTHQVNITALTSIFPASGEGIVLRPAKGSETGFEMLGRLRFGG
ncbi:MAG: histidine phosphatase family protein [Alphaproteobacteria bacterium]|nr:histidine phosphatase family protein [Alphaproteobacteria bacterium]MBU0795855.1 histidine phosphatase family protein [Alphaproteobacteria bacterium]MBU0886933.1 histidine phosphatase family protein [Alphaproteobacteria bacterium]MBU1813211.1 histidine phosphatase family protein [Alphaproteobacteria bacterium]